MMKKKVMKKVMKKTTTTSISPHDKLLLEKSLYGGSVVPSTKTLTNVHSSALASLERIANANLHPSKKPHESGMFNYLNMILISIPSVHKFSELKPC